MKIKNCTNLTWRENILILSSVSTHIHFRAKETYFCDAWISREIKNIIKNALIRMMLLWIKWKVNLCIQPQKNRTFRSYFDWMRQKHTQKNIIYCIERATIYRVFFVQNTLFGWERECHSVWIDVVPIVIVAYTLLLL